MESFSSHNEKFLRSVVEITPFPIGVYVGNELRIVLANNAMLDTWGKGNDVVGKLYTEILPELENQEIFDQIRNVLRTAQAFHAKDARVDLVIDGILKTHYFNYSFNPLHDDEGNVYGVVNTGADVTDLNTSRRQTKEAEMRLRLMVESADLGVYEADLLTNEIVTSEKFNQIWGVEGVPDQEEIVQRIHPDDLPVREEAHNKYHETGKINYEIRLYHKDETLHWIKVNGKIIKNEKGIAVTLIAISQDTTVHKQFTQQLAELVEQRTIDLQRSNGDLTQFAHIVSHDLKEPMRKVKIFNDILKNRFAHDLDAKGKEYIQKVQLAADRMMLIVDDVLTYSTMNSSGYPPEKIDLNEIIENIKTDLELVIHEKQAILIRDELPEIEGAHILIHQLFYNLINNALKFSKAKEPPRVSISSSIIKKGNEEYVKVIIKDNGIGIDQEDAERIFDAFQRLHSKEEYEGTGLGLSLCRKIAERHQGTILASGKKDEGSEFSVCLPLKQTNKSSI